MKKFLKIILISIFSLSCLPQAIANEKFEAVLEYEDGHEEIGLVKMVMYGDSFLYFSFKEDNATNFNKIDVQSLSRMTLKTPVGTVVQFDACYIIKGAIRATYPKKKVLLMIYRGGDNCYLATAGAYRYSKRTGNFYVTYDAVFGAPIYFRDFNNERAVHIGYADLESSTAEFINMLNKSKECANAYKEYFKQTCPDFLRERPFSREDINIIQFMDLYRATCPSS